MFLVFDILKLHIVDFCGLKKKKLDFFDANLRTKYIIYNQSI